MITTMNSKLLHRTKLMDAQQAERWSKALSANSRFEDAEVIESNRTTKTARFYVAYKPSSPDAQQAMLDAERGAREERARAEEFAFVWDGALGAYRCRSEQSGKTYEVSTSSCNCGDWLHRGSVVGLPCKHQCALVSALEDGLAGEEEALEVEACEVCNEPTSERVPTHAEDGPASLPMCGPCREQQQEDAERTMLPARPVTREEQRKADQERFRAVFGSTNEEWTR